MQERVEGENVQQSQPELGARGGARAGSRRRQLEGEEGREGARAGSRCEQLEGVVGERHQPELGGRGGASSL